MSKGDRNRSISPEFKDGYDNINWGDPKPNRFERQAAPKRKMHHIMVDIEPYIPVGGDGGHKTVITSRSKEREYLKRNNCIQVGNEKETFFKHNGKTEDNTTKDW